MTLTITNGHIGDCFWAALLLSKVPGPHVFHMPDEYHAEFKELLDGLDITILSGAGDNDCWIANGRFEDRGIIYRDQPDILGFVRVYLNAMAEANGHEAPFQRDGDMLCEFPALLERATSTASVLVVNADPKSGQCPGYSSSEMDGLIERLAARHQVIVTNPTPVKSDNISYCNGEASLAEIGAAAIDALLIVGCATGPWWPTLNAFNKSAQRVVLLDPMRLDCGVSIEHAANAAEATRHLERMGWL